MKSVGKIKGLMRDSETGRYILQLETDSRISVGYEDLKGETVDIIIRKHREKRQTCGTASHLRRREPG